MRKGEETMKPQVIKEQSTLIITQCRHVIRAFQEGTLTLVEMEAGLKVILLLHQKLPVLQGTEGLAA